MRGAGFLTTHETKEVIGRFQYVTGNSPDLELWIFIFKADIVNINEVYD